MKRNLKILLVDDEEDVLNTIGLLLSASAAEVYEIVKINNGKDAIDFIAANKNDLKIIISDINMDGINGIRLAKMVGEINPEIRIVLMTGYISIIDQIKHFQLGVEKILTKPFTIDELLAVIEGPYEQKTNNSSEMVPVKIESLISAQKNPVDLYVYISGDKYLKMFHAKHHVDIPRLQQFLNQDTFYLYATQEEALNVDLNFYIPVRISTLKTNRTLNFNVFLCNKDLEYKLLIPNGLVLNSEMLKLIKDRHLKVLYIRDNDQPLYLKYLDNILDDFMLNKEVSSNDKLAAASSLVSARTEETLFNPTMANLINLKTSQKHLIDFLKNDRSSIKELIKLNETNKGVHVHSTMVASLSYALLLELSAMRADPEEKLKIRALDEYIFEKDELKEIIFTGALLHDLGKLLLQISESVTTSALNEVEYLNLQEHPQVAFLKLKDSGLVHPKSLEIIIQHEEFCDGSGYPYKLKKASISFFSQVVILANSFDKFKRIENLSNEKALLAIKKTPEKFNRHLILILESILADKK